MIYKFVGGYGRYGIEHAVVHHPGKEHFVQVNIEREIIANVIDITVLSVDTRLIKVYSNRQEYRSTKMCCSSSGLDTLPAAIKCKMHCATSSVEKGSGGVER